MARVPQEDVLSSKVGKVTWIAIGVIVIAFLIVVTIWNRSIYSQCKLGDMRQADTLRDRYSIHSPITCNYGVVRVTTADEVNRVIDAMMSDHWIASERKDLPRGNPNEYEIFFHSSQFKDVSAAVRSARNTGRLELMFMIN